MKTRLKSWLEAWPAVGRFWTAHRARAVEEDYRRRRERYHSVCVEKNLRADNGASAAGARKGLVSRGFSPRPKPVGQVHTAAFIPRVVWHRHLYPDLHALGPITEFDYEKEGFRMGELYGAGRRATERRAAMNRLFLDRVKEAHRLRPVDWVYIYAQGFEVSPEMLRALQQEVGAPVVLMSLDDKQSWEGPDLGGHRAGMVDLTAAADLVWTSSRATCGWHLAEGGRPYFLPEGTDVNFFHPTGVPRDMDASFVGVSYGFRAGLARDLRANGLDVKVFGPGWPAGPVSDEEMVHVFNRSRVVLGMGGVHASEMLTNVKGRDFDVPATGGGMHLTSFNPDLALFFDVGREIVCYRSRDEMVELARYYLGHEDEARAVAVRARERCLKEHRWLHRYIEICRALGVVF